MKFSAAASALRASVRGLFRDTNALANVTVLGVKDAVNSVSFNGAKIAGGWSYNGSSQVLAVTGLGNRTSGGTWSRDWVLSWS